MRTAAAVLALASLAGCGVAVKSRPKHDPLGSTVHFIPQSVSFVSPLLGWAWGPAWRPGPSPAPGVLARTEDGGHSWSGVGTPSIAYGEVGFGSGVVGVRFADTLHGYLFGRQLWLTADGGRRWRRLPTPGPILDLEAGADRAYALVLDCASVAACDSAHLYRVARSGKLVQVGPRSAVDARWWSLLVHGPAVYLLVPTPESGTSVRPAALWVSRDGGRSWRHLTAPCTWDGSGGSKLAAWSQSGLAMACGGQPSAGNQDKTFYASGDGGQSWRLVNRGPFGPGYIASLTAADANTWVLGEARGQIEVTVDGGRRWRVARFVGETAAVEGWGYVSFIEGMHGVAVPWTLNGDVLAFTSNAGQSWRLAGFGAREGQPAANRSLPPAPSPNPWRAYETGVNPGRGIEFVSPTTAFALSGQPVDALDGSLAAPEGLTVVWPSPSVLVSKTRGRSWRNLLSAPAGFWGLAVGGFPLGFAVGVNALYRTRDGGRHWQRIAEPTKPLVRVAILSGYAAVAITADGGMVMTDDGGSTWQPAAWSRSSRAMCSLGDGVFVADRRGGVWSSKSPGYPFTEVAPARARPIKDSDWWVGLSCAGQNVVEFMQAFPDAAGADVVTVVRESTDGGFTWRHVAEIDWGAGNQAAPLPAEAVAVGTRTVCLFSYA